MAEHGAVDLAHAALELQVLATDNDGLYPSSVPTDAASSPDVVVSFGTSASASRICLKGDHDALSESLYYDSAAGGLTTLAC